MNLFKNKWKLREQKSYYFVYSACFLLVTLFVFSWYFFTGKTFIWKLDGWQQYYKALVYYAQYLRSIIKELLLHHKLTIPHYDFSIGEGSDILQTLHYYVIGDPFSFLSVLVPSRYMFLYYNVSILLRMYLSGIAFSMLCFQTGNKSRYAVLAGAITYVFCDWAIYSAVRHPMFLNPMLYLPLLIIGIEKIIKGKSPYLFIGMVAISAMSNFFFFYMLALLVIIYVLIRTSLLYHKNIKEAVLLIIRIGISSILGLLLSAVITAPVIYSFLSDTRMSAYPLHLFYPLSYYSKLPALFITEESNWEFSYYLNMGFAIPVLFAVFLLFYKHNKFKLLKGLFTSCVVIMLFPFLGQILNGFSYMSNRWCFAFALVSAYILTMMWPFLMNLKTKEGVFLFICTTIYFSVCLFLQYSRTIKAFIIISLALILLFVLFPLSEKEPVFSLKSKQQITLLILFISIGLNSFWKNSFSEDNVASESLHISVMSLLTENEASTVDSVAVSDNMDEFYRYSGRDLTANANMIAGISSTQYYWSLSNPKTTEYRSQLNLIDNIAFRYTGYDDRTALTALASVLYYVIPENDSDPVPYGFVPLDTGVEQAPYKIYRNEYALPFSYTYDNYILEDTWEPLSTAEKQETMLQSAVLYEDTMYSEKGKPNLDSYDIPYTITCGGNEITRQDNNFVVTSADATATITFEGVPDSETYFEIEGLNFYGISEYDLYYGDESLDPLNLYNEAHWNLLSDTRHASIKKEKIYWSSPKAAAITLTSENNISKSISYYTPDHSGYNNRHDFVVNFGYSEDTLSSIEIKFPVRGIYSFDSINIVCQPMDRYAEQVETLKKDSLENVIFDTDTVTGEITLETPKLLCFSIPFSIGWTAYVDGKPAKLYQTNIMHMALDLDAGAHSIKLVYKTPFLKAGICLSLVGVIILILGEYLARIYNGGRQRTCLSGKRNKITDEKTEERSND